MFNVNDQDTRSTPEAFSEDNWRWKAITIFTKSFSSHSGVLNDNFEHIPYLSLVFLLLTLNK